MLFRSSDTPPSTTLLLQMHLLHKLHYNRTHPSQGLYETIIPTSPLRRLQPPLRHLHPWRRRKSPRRPSHHQTLPCASRLSFRRLTQPRPNSHPQPLPLLRPPPTSTPLHMHTLQPCLLPLPKPTNLQRRRRERYPDIMLSAG